MDPFKAPKPPPLTPPPVMPDPNTDTIRQANQKATGAVLKRAGRSSTYLSAGSGPGGTAGPGDYSATTLGAGR